MFEINRLIAKASSWKFASSSAALTASDKLGLLAKVRNFEAFDRDNDPHSEHDFVSIEHDGVRYFGKIDYYAQDLEHGSEDPADPLQTIRVLTIMRADEY